MQNLLPGIVPRGTKHIPLPYKIKSNRLLGIHFDLARETPNNGILKCEMGIWKEALETPENDTSIISPMQGVLSCSQTPMVW